MRKFFSLLVLCLGLHANDDYEAALQTQKPLLVAFLQADCPWSKKLEGEVLTNDGFQKTLKSTFTFVRSESSELRKKFHISELPTLALITPFEEEISKIGYTPMEALEFAERILDIYQGYSAIIKNFRPSSSAQELQELYQIAASLGLVHLQDRILEAGLKVSETTFFLLEQYSHLMKRGTKKKILEALREQILAKDPDNVEGSHFYLALCDFQDRADHGSAAKEALKPLKKYLKEFGERDRGNAQRAHLLMAQFLRGKEQFEEADSHIKAAQELRG